MSTGRSFRIRLFGIGVVAVALTLGLPALSGLQNASVGAASPLTVSIGSASVVATGRGQSSIFLPVTLSQPSSSAVTVSYQTSDGSAQAGQAYAATSGTVTFPVDSSTGTTALTQYAPVPVYAGGAGSFTVTLSNPVGAKLGNSTGMATILSGPRGRWIRVNAGDMSIYDGVSGGTRWALGLVTLSHTSSRPVTVNYSVVPDTATPGTTFLAATTGTLDIEPGTLSAWVGVSVVSGTVPRHREDDHAQPHAGIRRGDRTIVRDRHHRSGAVGPRDADGDTDDHEAADDHARPGAEGRAAADLVDDPEHAAELTDAHHAAAGFAVVSGRSPSAGHRLRRRVQRHGLDTSKWQPNWLASNNTTITKPINGSELSCYDPAQVSVSGRLPAPQRRRTRRAAPTTGHLRLRVRASSNTNAALHLHLRPHGGAHVPAG